MTAKRNMAMLLVACLIVVSVAPRLASQTAESTPAVRFAWLDVFVDSQDMPLAAWQFELVDRSGATKIVGLEGGEHEAFRDPPYYDPAALQQSRVIVAAFSTGKDLPKGKTRVARIHVQIAGDGKPDYAIELTVAASADGKRIPANISYVQGATP